MVEDCVSLATIWVLVTDRAWRQTVLKSINGRDPCSGLHELLWWNNWEVVWHLNLFWLVVDRYLCEKPRVRLKTFKLALSSSVGICFLLLLLLLNQFPVSGSPLGNLKWQNQSTCVTQWFARFKKWWICETKGTCKNICLTITSGLGF